VTITPEQLAKPGSEHAHQSALFCWAAQMANNGYPELRLLFAIPNGGERNIKVAAQLKAEGVKAGVPDIFLPVPSAFWAGLFIEMKVKPNKPSVDQCEWLTRLSEQRYFTKVCWSWEEAANTILEYLKG
jgi:hypothetical protein